MNDAQQFLQEQMKKAEHTIQFLEEGRERVYKYIVENSLDEAYFEEKLLVLNQNIDRLKDQYKRLGELADQAAKEAMELEADITKSE